ncbi:hypothetical protein FSB78_11235 [Sphingomonas ginsenosidivorax]|uniref:Uncharacterized protein n=1 Tax=Sphingomonas ginsenosidivorax TaxID=862135 RepID=A0A5C6UGT9_9SPHN|nr:hypothetical protein [Sphingomonas ginsenosidivorax]TXC71451.1 hypothetical protein FSB78_11235 [Sphingomonas ginsenosidivorax]
MTMTFVDALASAICRQMTADQGREPLLPSARGRHQDLQRSQATVRLGRHGVERVASAIAGQLAAADRRLELPLEAVEI